MRKKMAIRKNALISFGDWSNSAAIKVNGFPNTSSSAAKTQSASCSSSRPFLKGPEMPKSTGNEVNTVKKL